MQKRFIKKVVLAFLVVGFVFSINYFTSGGIQNITYRLLSGISGLGSSSVNYTVDYLHGLRNIDNLIEQNQQLRKDARLLIASDAKVKELLAENENLREQLEVDKSSSKRLFEVGILDIQRTPFASSIIIDAGEDHGVYKGSQVIIGGNILIGIIDEVYKNSSRVLLLDDPRVHVSVRTLGSDVLSNTLGKLNSEMVLDLITAQDRVEEGEIVVTSGLDEFDASLVVGTIKFSIQRDDALFRNVTAQMLIGSLSKEQIFLLL